jgi:hypothetical protein
VTNPDYTHLALIVDRSGSMATIRQDMEGGITELLKEQAELPGKLLVDVTLFDDRVETPIVGAAAADTQVQILPRGMTALHDALGRTITELGERLAALDENERPGKVLVVVVTDGYENRSRDWSGEQVKELVTQQQDKYSWDFVFLGANIDAATTGGALGFQGGSTLNYAATSKGARGATRSLSTYMTGYRTAGSASFDTAQDDADATV